MAAFRLSLAHGSLLHLSPAAIIRIAATVGYEHVGLRLIPVGYEGEPTHRLELDAGDLRQLRQLLDDTGVRFLDVELVRITAAFDPKSHLPVLEASAQLGARFVLANVYGLDRAAAEDHFGALSALVARLGLAVALEPVSFSSLPTVTDAIQLVTAAGREEDCVLVDVLHVHSSGEPLKAVAELPRNRVHFAHVCDGPGLVPDAVDDRRRIAREGRMLPGEGGIDVAGILRALPPGIVYTVEVHNSARAHALGAEAYARLAFEKTRGYLASHLP